MTLQSFISGQIMKYLWLLLVVFFLPGAVHAQYDSTYYHRTMFEFGKEVGMEGTTVRVPFRISGGAYNGLELAPWTFGVMFDSTLLEFQRITLATGNPYQSLPLTWWPIPGGVHIGMEQPVMVYDTATLFYLEFEIQSIDDTTCVELEIVNWYFNGGRVRPVLYSGEVCMVPIPPRPKGSIEMPHELTWVRSKRDYVPNPFTVRALIKNEGGGDIAKHVMFKIDYDPAGFELVSPITNIQPGSLLNVNSNETSDASWLVKARTRLTGDSVMIAVTAMFDNHPDIVLYQKMWIPPTEPVLLCSIDPVHITADYENERYTPMPFDLIVHVTNDGGMATDSVYGRIELPPALQFAGEDAPSRTSKKLDPGRLVPYQSGTVSWSLSCPLFENDTSFVVSVWIRTANADSSRCETLVHLPAMGVPSLRGADHCPGQLMINDSTGLYEPNPFEVSITAVNLAKTPANNVSAFLYLPDGVVLDPPGQSLRQDFGTLGRWQTGDPIPVKHVTVRWDRMYRYNTVAGFKWAIGCVSSFSGLPMDTIWAYSETDIPGVKPYYYSKIIGPSHIAWDDSNNCYVPNPFTVRLTIFNSSHTTGTINRMELHYPNDGIRLDTSVQGNTAVREVHQFLLPGDSVWTEWVLHIDPRLDGRNIDLSMNAFDDEGNPLGGGRRIIIPGVKTCLGYRDNNSTHLVDYDSSMQLYTDRRITFSHGLYNCGEWTYNNPWIELTLDDPEGYLVYDTAFANPQRVTADKLSPGDTLYGTWHLRLAKPNTTGGVGTIGYRFLIGVDGETVDSANVQYLEIEPAMVVGIDEPTQPGGIALSQNYPNPFNPTTEIEYAIPQATHVLLRAFDALGREVTVLVNEWKAPGAYRVAFDATDLPAGTYVYRLETGQRVLSKKMVVVK